MLKKVLYPIIFLCVPVAILITAAMRREPTYQREPATVWVGRLRTSSKADRDTALKALQHMGEGSLPALREMLNGSSGTESMRAAWAMGRLGPASKNAVPDLLQAMRERGNTGLQIEAMNSLSHVGLTNEDIVPEVMSQLTNSVLCGYAATLLNSMERERQIENLPPFPEAGYIYGMACLKSQSRGVRINGAIHLAKIAQKDERAKAALQSLLNDEDIAIRVQTANLMTNSDALPDFKMVSDN